MRVFLFPLSIFFYLLCLTGAASAQPPAGKAVKLTSLPVLDGKVMGDHAWDSAPMMSGFQQSQPDEGQPASQPTAVFIGFSDKALYIAAVLHDDQPERIIVSDSRRDADLDETDSFQIIIDSFRDGQNGLVFGTNPAGIQYDGQVSREGSNSSAFGAGGFNRDWDTTWEVATHVGDFGWSLEMEIPFKSLRYGAGDSQAWGFNFQRNIRRNNEQAFWAPLQRQYSIFRVSEAGSIHGLKPPAQRNLKLTPYVLAKGQQGTDFDGTETDQELGLDLKYSITESLTLDATLNTDFAQVEIDDVVVNLDRFSVFIPEKRPFFLENAGQFAVGTPQDVELFFSRRIGISGSGQAAPIDYGLRLSGKLGGSTNIGVLRMSTDAIDSVTRGNDYSVLRVNQELANRSSLGAIYVEREGERSGDDNKTYGVDGQWGIGDKLMLSSYYAKTDTPGLDGKDHAMRFRADYNSQAWSNFLYYSEVGEDFNPEVGFVARKDYRRWSALSLYRYRPEDLWGLHELRPHILFRGNWGFDGEKQSSYLHIDNHWEWKSGMELHTGVNLVHETVRRPFNLVANQTVPVGSYDNEELQLVFFTNQGAPLSFDIEMRAGGFFSGDKLTLEPILKYRIGHKFNSELSWNYNRIDLGEGEFDINVGQLKLAYSFTPKMSLESLIQYDDRTDSTAVNLRFAWLQSANAGLYLVYNELDSEPFGAERERRELVLKFSYIFDVL